MFGLKLPSEGIRPRKTRTLTTNGLAADHAADSLPMQPIAEPKPTPDAAAELAAAETQLCFLIREFNSAQASLAKFPRSSFTPPQDQTTRCLQYREVLESGQSLASEAATDGSLLLTVLRCCPGSAISPDGGLIAEAQAKINTLKAPKLDQSHRTAEHQQLIAAERKAFKAWAKAHTTRRKHERDNVPIPLHSRTQSVRPAFGMNASQFSEMELDKVAAFAANLADE